MCKLLCALGIHSYERVELVSIVSAFLSISTDGDVCERCGHIPPPHKYSAEEMVAHAMTIRGMKVAIFVHPRILP